jgi:hypothetical protein
MWGEMQFESDSGSRKPRLRSKQMTHRSFTIYACVSIVVPVTGAADSAFSDASKPDVNFARGPWIWVDAPNKTRYNDSSDDRKE